jgi:hypothetical protein
MNNTDNINKLTTSSFTELTSEETAEIDGGKITMYDLGYYSHAVYDRLNDLIEKFPYLHFM